MTKDDRESPATRNDEAARPSLPDNSSGIGLAAFESQRAARTTKHEAAYWQRAEQLAVCTSEKRATQLATELADDAKALGIDDETVRENVQAIAELRSLPDAEVVVRELQATQKQIDEDRGREKRRWQAAAEEHNARLEDMQRRDGAVMQGFRENSAAVERRAALERALIDAGAPVAVMKPARS